MIFSIYYLSIGIYLGISFCRCTKSAVESLSDLSSDPYEKRDVLTTSAYASTLSTIYERISYWQELKKDPEVPSTSTMKSSFANCGGVCPWISKSFTPEETPDTYKTVSAPHIVFVMIDDWGYNDVGYQSTYMDWGTPTLDTLVSAGIKLTNYFTHASSLPSRGALLTGRYAARLGLWEAKSSSAELPLDESTIAQELQTSGYRTYMVGKWGLGMSTKYHNPIERGFDYFYGHLSESVDPWTKTESLGYVDLFEGLDIVTDKDALSSSKHIAELFDEKIADVIEDHATNYANKPMFIYYSIPLMSSYDDTYSVPSSYLQHCDDISSDVISDDITRTNLRSYCAMNIMLDHLIANLTCALQKYNFDKKLVMIITSDNGGDANMMPGSNYPYMGGSGDHSRGGVSVNSIIYSSIFSSSLHGLSLSTLTHVTDWLPTIMHLATDSKWSSPVNGYDIDGYDIWDAIITHGDSDRTEMLHAIDSSEYSYQIGMVKYDYGINTHLTTPSYTFGYDINPDTSVTYSCSTPGFIDDNDNDMVITETILVDLSIDEYEENNYYDTTSYADIQSTLTDRASYWQTQVIEPETPTDGDKKKTWKACGGLCPWKTSSYTPLEVTQKYSYHHAPHIIYLFVDDWGWNDFGMRSSYMSWSTPTIDRLAQEGVLLSNYYSHSSCVPSRGAFLTGRYSIRLGLYGTGESAELPLSETTIAQELKSAGYRTYMVGKWHMGYSTTQHLPTNRGFDRYYGYVSGFVDYWTKAYGNYLDLRDGLNLVTDADELSSSYHNGYLLQHKAEDMIHDHMASYSDKPMFLYYALQLIHGVWDAPQSFLDRCGMPSLNDVGTEYLQDVTYNYCGLNVMLDEVIANITCTLDQYDLIDNTIMMIVSDNGGETTMPGNNYPFRGGKGSTTRGGVSTTAMIHSPLIPEDMRGQTYDGLMHITDWIPTLMGRATGGSWRGSLTGATLDGVDMWDAIMTNSASPRHEIVHYADGIASACIQQDEIKLFLGFNTAPYSYVLTYFKHDLVPNNSYMMCDTPSLIDYASGDTVISYDDDGDDVVDGPRSHQSSILVTIFRGMIRIIGILIIAFAALGATISMILAIHTCKCMIQDRLYPKHEMRYGDKIFYSAETVASLSKANHHLGLHDIPLRRAIDPEYSIPASDDLDRTAYVDIDDINEHSNLL